MATAPSFLDYNERADRVGRFPQWSLFASISTRNRFDPAQGAVLLKLQKYNVSDIPSVAMKNDLRDNQKKYCCLNTTGDPG